MLRAPILLLLSPVSSEWNILKSSGLAEFEPAFVQAGASSDTDLALLTDADLQSLGLNLIQRRRLQQRLAHATATASETVDGLRTFGSAGKQITLAAGENELYNHTCSKRRALGSICILGHMWFGGAWDRYGISRLRIYVDGEAAPSIDGQLYLLHGIVEGLQDGEAAPWSSGSLLGRTGKPSGTFNTLQIPFSKTIRVTMQSYDGPSRPSNASQRFWWIFRGTEGEAAVALGSRTLPTSARLRLHTREDVMVPPTSFLSLLDTPSAGAVLMTTLSVHAESENFLEGEIRVNMSSMARESCSYGVCSSVTMSSGTEDYFLGTYYFNEGGYHNALAGCTHLQHIDGHSWEFAGYRRHDRDLLTFGPGSTQMSWRCGEPGVGNPTACTVSSYVLVYEW